MVVKRGKNFHRSVSKVHNVVQVLTPICAICIFKRVEGCNTPNKGEKKGLFPLFSYSSYSWPYQLSIPVSIIPVHSYVWSRLLHDFGTTFSATMIMFEANILFITVKFMNKSYEPKHILIAAQ